jgi:ABC-type Na+ efflux pump permease subunit
LPSSDGPGSHGNPVLWREWHRNRPSRMTRILWGAYWLGAIAGVGIGLVNAIENGIDTPSGGFVLIMSLVLQSFLGMMLLSGQAPTSLGEERVRGSLDVLMSTPISTRAIVRGKWLGTFRVALWLAILPGLAATIMACAIPAVPSSVTTRAGTATNVVPLTLADRIATPALVAGEMLSYGAAITSLGLFLATWIARPGRAIAISVAAFVLVAIGWPFAFDMFIWRPLQNWLVTSGNMAGVDLNWIPQGLVMGSPLLGPAMTLDVLGEPWMGHHRWKLNLVALAWCLLAWALAGALYWAVLKSFDRRLGRMRETSPTHPYPFGKGPSRPELDLLADLEIALIGDGHAASPRLARGDDVRQDEDP